VPQKDTLRRACLTILTQICSPGPSSLSKFVKKKKKKKRRNYSDANDLFEGQLHDATNIHGLPASAANRFRTFVTQGCMPLPCDIDEAFDAIESAVSRLRSTDNDARLDPRRMKRYEDVAKSLKSLRFLVGSLKALGITPWFGPGKPSGTIGTCAGTRLNRPLYISLDLGLRQRRKHFHGHTLFQCIVLPDTYFDEIGDSDEHNDFVISAGGLGIKVAEGGRYDDLVRPPRVANLYLSSFTNFFTTTAGQEIPASRELWFSYIQSLHHGSHSYGTFLLNLFRLC
jgi:hypothetical protein